MAWRWAVHWVRWMCAFIGACWLLITFTPLVKFVAGKLAVDWYEGDGDVLVVLGGAMLVPGTGERATIGFDTYLRTAYAAWMLKTFKFRKVIVSGGGGLAHGMAEFLIAEGVPASSILLESHSQNTSENAVYVKQLLTQQGIPIQGSTVVIVTSDYHSWRARFLFRHYGLPVRVMPAPDVSKRANSLLYRVEGFFTVAGELLKDVVYSVDPQFRT